HVCISHSGGAVGAKVDVGDAGLVQMGADGLFQSKAAVVGGQRDGFCHGDTSLTFFVLAGGQAGGTLPLGLAQPVIVGQQGFGRDGKPRPGHPLGGQRDPGGPPAPQGGGHRQHAFCLTVDIITQISPVTNKKEGLFAVFYKICQTAGGAGVVLQQAGVGGQVEGGGVDLPPPG